MSGRISTSPALLKYVINRRKITKEGVFWRVKNGAGMIRWIFCSRFSRQNWTKVKSRRPKWNEALIQNTADATAWKFFWRLFLKYHKNSFSRKPKILWKNILVVLWRYYLFQKLQKDMIDSVYVWGLLENIFVFVFWRKI